MNGIVQAYAQVGITLEKIGKYWRSPCPFHKESDPSFTVYPDGSYFCFGCRKSGKIEHLYKDLDMGDLFFTNPIDVQTCSEKKGVDFFRDLRIMELQLMKARKKVSERSSLYRSVFMAERIMALSSGSRNRIKIFRKIRRLLGIVQPESIAEAGR